MEKIPSVTDSGIFDVETHQSDSLDNLRTITIADGQKRSWEFYKNSDDPHMVDIISFAEELERRVQSLTPYITIPEAIQTECAYAFSNQDTDTSIRMKIRAIRLLSRHWVHGEALRNVFEEYWRDEGAALAEAEQELFEAHLD